HDRIGNDHLHRSNLLEQRVMTRTEPGCAEVAAHTIPEGARLADVDRLASRVAPEIDPRLLGQPRDLLLQVEDGHGVRRRGGISVLVYSVDLIPSTETPNYN